MHHIAKISPTYSFRVRDAQISCDALNTFRPLSFLLGELVNSLFPKGLNLVLKSRRQLVGARAG